MMLRPLCLALSLAATGAASQPVQCPDTPITVDAPTPALAQRVCTAAARALPGMAACHIALRDPVEIAFVDTLPDGCVGLFHCGEARIELLPPDIADRRRTDESPFRLLPPDAFYDSIVVHELAHAIYDRVACPFEGCPVTSEYVAYVAQIRSLTPAQIAEVERLSDPGEPVSREDLSLMLLLMAPNRFASRVWAHFRQRDDGCAYIGQIMSGGILLDGERP